MEACRGAPTDVERQNQRNLRMRNAANKVERLTPAGILIMHYVWEIH